MSEIKEIINTSKSFEKKLMDTDKTSKKTAWIIASVAVVIVILLTIAIMLMLPLKQTDTALYIIDSHTGRSEFVTRVKEKDLTENDAISKSYVANYVKLREGYNYFSLQNDYDTVQLFNSDEVNSEYIDWFAGPNAPDKVNKNAEYVVKTEIISDPISYATKPDKLANVRVKTTTRRVADGSTQVSIWNIRMTFRYIPSKELTDSQRESNPLGFIVTSYQREKELRKE
ncbi:membrane protein [Erwinia typographi]|uniref:Membrane protein n=1 Tax=Erwinia typographi TaxID=371042 RepID=A0A0A3YJT1_9GAMM|nr:type IV secretion system protein [Erwinia typographi]KGT87017.1 membrane protein [Erwinia typographi]